MFKHYFEGIEGIADGPVASLLIFFIFFILVFVLISRMKKSDVDYLKNLPLQDTVEESSANNLNDRNS
jgi:cbb3-type cytochrome oxidase subunit 3